MSPAYIVLSGRLVSGEYIFCTRQERDLSLLVSVHVRGPEHLLTAVLWSVMVSWTLISLPSSALGI
jgi:hypothetical protein